MNWPFQTAQQLTPTALPAEFEVLAPPPFCCRAKLLRITRRCGRRYSPTLRHGRPLNGWSRSTSLNSPGRSSATACCVTSFWRPIAKRQLRPHYGASTWLESDPNSRARRSTTRCRPLSAEIFAGACGTHMYRLIMAIRLDALPTDPAALTEMVLALDAENEKLRVAMQTLKEMIFGKRSERLATLVAEQLALELDDLEIGVTPPALANDDVAVAKPPGEPRKKARRNIGALPKHLPRCEGVLEPEATACPCCQGRLHLPQAAELVIDRGITCPARHGRYGFASRLSAPARPKPRHKSSNEGHGVVEGFLGRAVGINGHLLSAAQDGVMVSALGLQIRPVFDLDDGN
ncbi:hypothetical protein ACVWXO_005427 [Bradyrhizobium sp. LM2.7]